MTLSLWSRRILLPFAVTRAGLLLAGVLALGLIGSVRDRMPGNLVAHLPAWKGRSMAVVLADDDGEILSLLTASHQPDPRMRLGNLHDMDEP